MEKSGQRKAKKNFGLDFMLKRVEPDENGVKQGDDGSPSLLLAEAEKILGGASEMDAKALVLPASSTGDQEVEEERIAQVEEMMKEREGGNNILAEVVPHSLSRSSVEEKKVQQGIKKNLSLDFMLRKPSRGSAVESMSINGQGFESISDLGEGAGDILAERVSSSSLKLPTDRKVEGVKGNLGLGFMLKKPSKVETEIVETENARKGFDSIPNLGETIKDLGLVPSQIESTTNGDQISLVGATKEETVKGEFKLAGDGDIKNGEEEDLAALVNQQVDKKSKQTFKKLLSISKVKNGNSGMGKMDSGEQQQEQVQSANCLVPYLEIVLLQRAGMNTAPR